MATTTEFKKVEHVNNNKTCFFEVNHANQKNYIDSELIAITHFVMEKIQSKHGVTDRTVSPKHIFIDAIKKAFDVDITLDDLNRSKAHHLKLQESERIQENTGKADAFIVNDVLFNFATKKLNDGMSETDLKALLYKAQPTKKAEIDQNLEYIQQQKALSCDVPTF